MRSTIRSASSALISWKLTSVLFPPERCRERLVILRMIILDASQHPGRLFKRAVAINRAVDAILAAATPSLGLTGQARGRPFRAGRRPVRCCRLPLVAELHACGVVLGDGHGAVRVSQRGGVGVSGVNYAGLPAGVERGA